jgi:ABC-type Mn2+/Zn2+ transport system permease subunit
MPTFITPNFDLVPLTIFCLCATILACVAGLFHARYRDNWPQTIGMFAVAVSCALKLEQVRLRGFVSGETALLAVGIALFAAGVVWKVWQHERNAPPPTLHRDL